MSLLVPIDPSAPSRAAVALTALVAAALDHDVVLLHVSDRQAGLSDLAALHELALPLHDSGARVHLRTRTGAVARTICDEAVARRCSWILMGTRGGAGSYSESVAREVMGCALCPVVAIRPGSPSLSADHLPLALLSPAPGPALRRLADELAGARVSSWRSCRVQPGTGALEPEDGGPPLEHGGVLVPSDALWPTASLGRAAPWWPALRDLERRPVVVVSEGRRAG